MLPMTKILEVAKRDNAVFMFVCGLEEFQVDPARSPFKNAWGDTMRLGARLGAPWTPLAREALPRSPAVAAGPTPPNPRG